MAISLPSSVGAAGNSEIMAAERPPSTGRLTPVDVPRAVRREEDHDVCDIRAVANAAQRHARLALLPQTGVEIHLVMHGVAIIPGLIAMHRIPRGPHSIAVRLVRPGRMPAFDGEYAPRIGIADSAVTELMLTITPRPAASIHRPTELVH